MKYLVTYSVSLFQGFHSLNFGKLHQDVGRTRRVVTAWGRCNQDVSCNYPFGIWELGLPNAAVHLQAKGWWYVKIGMSVHSFTHFSWFFTGVHIINLRRTWEKILLAARAIVAIEKPGDVYVISSRAYGQRAVLKFGHYTGATAIAGRFTPGAFTNQIQVCSVESHLVFHFEWWESICILHTSLK